MSFDTLIYIGKRSGLPYVRKGMHTMCRGKLLRSCTLARKVYKSLMSEGFRELTWTRPLCSTLMNIVSLLGRPSCAINYWRPQVIDLLTTEIRSYSI